MLLRTFVAATLLAPVGCAVDVEDTQSVSQAVHRRGHRRGRVSICHLGRGGAYRLRHLPARHARRHLRHHPHDCRLGSATSCPEPGTPIGPDRSCETPAPEVCISVLSGHVVGDVVVPDGASCTIAGVLTGDLVVDGALVVSGSVVGNIEVRGVTGATLTLAPAGVVDGSVTAIGAPCFSRVSLTADGSITGDVHLQSSTALLTIDAPYCDDLHTCVGSNLIVGDVICSAGARSFRAEAIGAVEGSFDCDPYDPPSGCGR